MPKFFLLIFIAISAALEVSATNPLQEIESLDSETSSAHSAFATPVEIWIGDTSPQQVCGLDCQTLSNKLKHKKSTLVGKIEFFDVPWNNVDYTTPNGATFYVYITDADLDCRESYYGDGGFERCTVEISYSYESNYNGNDSPTVDVECEARIRTTDSEGWTRSRSESESDYHYGAYDYGRMELDFRFRSYYDPVVSVKVLDYDCYIQDVY